MPEPISKVPQFADYVQDRRYMKNVSAKTLAWYKDVSRVFDKLDTSSGAAIKTSLRSCVQAQLEKGTKPVSVNSWLTGIRAYLLWLHREGHLEEKPKVEMLKCEQRVLETLSAEQAKQFVMFKPVGTNQCRSHMAACVMLDSGLRLSETLDLRPKNIDLDNLVIRVIGKGNKERLVPMSLELRRMLYRWMKTHDGGLLFGTSVDTRITDRNFQRDLKALGKAAGITGVRFSPHTLRHSFAVNYLRRGGNLAYLQRILGHSSITVTEQYLRSLGIEDLQAVHSSLSLLSR